MKQNEKIKQFILQLSWIYVSVKNAELEKPNQKFSLRVVLRGDVMKFDSDSYAMFFEDRYAGTSSSCSIDFNPIKMEVTTILLRL